MAYVIKNTRTGRYLGSCPNSTGLTWFRSLDRAYVCQRSRHESLIKELFMFEHVKKRDKGNIKVLKVKLKIDD